MSRKKSKKLEGWVIIRRGPKEKVSPAMWNNKQSAWLPIGATIFKTEDAANAVLCKRFVEFATDLMKSAYGDLSGRALAEYKRYGEEEGLHGEIDVWPLKKAIEMYGRMP